MLDNNELKERGINKAYLFGLLDRGGMRISEVLILVAMDVDRRKHRIKNPKGGRQYEIVFIPQKVADRLKSYIQSKNPYSRKRVFSLGYSNARRIVKNACKSIGIKLRPHHLRRHAATYASRAGAPLEIVNKVILRHANLSTTQRYLGKISDTEAIRWIGNIHD